MTDTPDRSEPLLSIGEPGATAPAADIRVLGAPRPAVPQRLPVTPRFGGCASGAGVGAGAAATGHRRLPEWLKARLPGAGEYADTKALLRSHRLATVCE